MRKPAMTVDSPTDLVCEFVIPGSPVAKARPRFSPVNNSARNTPRTVNFEGHVKWLASAAMKGSFPVTGPVHLTVCFYFPIPKSWPKAKQKIADRNCYWHTGRPDSSNLLKAVEDGMNQIVYHDDSQICSLDIRKYYGPRPHVFVSVRELQFQTMEEGNG